MTTNSATIHNTNDPHHTLITINITAQAPLKLTANNYVSWKLQFQTLFIGYDLLGYIDGSTPCPSRTISHNGATIPNPAHIVWIRQDQLILNALIGSLSPTIIPFIAQATTSREAWTILANTYAKPSRGHIKQIKTHLKHITKGSQSISEYLQAIKSRADELAILGAPLDEDDLTDKILDNLGDDYKELVRAVQARDSSISFDELHEKLLNFEASLQAGKPDPVYFPASANIAHRHSGNRNAPGRRPSSNNHNSNTGWRQSQQSMDSSPTPTTVGSTPPGNRPPPRPYLGYCQICGIQGHTAKRCPSFRLVPNQPPLLPNVPQPNTATSWQPRAHFAANTASNTSWLLDSGASHHVTSDLSNLSLHAPYIGTDDIMIGDGSGLPITHTGSTSLKTPQTTFHLNNVLCVPSMKKNLISISQFCISNNVSIEFLPSSFLVKDLHTGTTLLRGSTKDGVYEWPISSPLLAFSSLKASSFEWHHRLGHPAFPILKHIISNNKLGLSSTLSSEYSCNACLSNKSHKLSFSTSTIVSFQPLEIVFSDVWTSPIISPDGFHYYVIFIDHFTKYMWFYPLKQKSEVKDVFIRFKAIVEKYFDTNIKTLYSDNGGEYISLATFLATNGISHKTTPPHTPEHNGFSERRHLHIVETGLALLTHASLPTVYWPHAFATAVYLINRMPTPSLSLSSPYEKIFGFAPNYSKLRVFGCLCYPWLRPYTSHKLESRSKPCIFLGYSLTQSAYYCLDPSTSKIYVSRHVKFVESLFPFTSLTQKSDCSQPNTINSWIPPQLCVTTNPSVSPLNTSTEVEAPQQSPCEVLSPSTISMPSPVPSPTPNPPLPTPTLTSPHSHQNSHPPPLNPPPPSHPMTTRAKNNIHKPIQKLTLHTQLSTPIALEPTTVTQALKDPQCRRAMSEEYDALVRNGTWELVPADPSHNVVGCKWIFRIKRHSDGSVDRFKARLVAKGFHQRPGVDYHDTFSPVVKPTTIRLVLSLAVSQGWKLRQLDVNNAFLQGHLFETVYMAQPQGFLDKDHPSHVCKLTKAIYGLKQAPRAWYQELRTFLLHSGFRNSHADTSLFVLHSNGHLLYLLVYVDDLIITGDSTSLVDWFVNLLANRFSLKDLGLLSYFLGVEVVPNTNGLFLSQRRYLLDILARTNMTQAKPVATPLPTGSSSLTLHSGTALSNPTEFRAVLGSLQYLLLTRPDIAFAVNKLSQFMHRPTSEHWALVKRLLRYLCGTIDDGLQLFKNSPLTLHAFSDADWAGNQDDFSSTSAHIVYLGRNAISWSSKKQRTIARSSTEAEYRSVAATTAELNWICLLLHDLGISLSTSPVVYCDNVGATQLCSNPLFHSRMKHVAIDFHFIRDQVQRGSLRVAHVASADQLADALTKPLPRPRFLLLKAKIGLLSRTPT